MNAPRDALFGGACLVKIVDGSGGDRMEPDREALASKYPCNDWQTC